MLPTEAPLTSPRRAMLQQGMIVEKRFEPRYGEAPICTSAEKEWGLCVLHGIFTRVGTGIDMDEDDDEEVFNKSQDKQAMMQ